MSRGKTTISKDGKRAEGNYRLNGTSIFGVREKIKIKSKYNHRKGKLEMVATDSEGIKIGSLEIIKTPQPTESGFFSRENVDSSAEAYYPFDAKIETWAQNQGLGTYMYDIASSQLAKRGNYIVPSPMQSDKAEGLWKRQERKWNDGVAVYNKLLNPNDLRVSGGTGDDLKAFGDPDGIITDIDKLSEKLDLDLEYIGRGEQRWVFAQPGDDNVLKINRYYLDDLPLPAKERKGDLDTEHGTSGFWEDHVTLHFAEKTPFMLDFIVPARVALTDEYMGQQSVIQRRVDTIDDWMMFDSGRLNYHIQVATGKREGREQNYEDSNEIYQKWLKYRDAEKEWRTNVLNEINNQYQLGNITEDVKGSLEEWVWEQDLGMGNFTIIDGKPVLLDYYAIPHEYFEMPTGFFESWNMEKDEVDGSDLIREQQEEEVRKIDWDFDDSEIRGWAVDETDYSEGIDSGERLICLRCGQTYDGCSCDNTYSKSADGPFERVFFKRQSTYKPNMANVTWRTPAAKRSIEKVQWDRWDEPGRNVAVPMTKAKARRVAENIRKRKAGGGVHLARVVPVKGGYVVYERPKDRKWRSTMIKRTRTRRGAPGGNLYLRRKR